MPVKIVLPIYKRMPLIYTDEHYEVEGEESYVIIRQARQGEHEQRQQLFDTISRKFNESDPDSVTLVQQIPMELLKRKEAWLTLTECNLQDEDGQYIFPSKKDKSGNPRLDMSLGEFERAWANLPPDIATDIHNQVLSVNYIWSGRLGEED